MRSVSQSAEIKRGLHIWVSSALGEFAYVAVAEQQNGWLVEVTAEVKACVFQVRHVFTCFPQCQLSKAGLSPSKQTQGWLDKDTCKDQSNLVKTRYLNNVGFSDMDLQNDNLRVKM